MNERRGPNSSEKALVECVDFLRSRIGGKIKVAVILGSGLGRLVDKASDRVDIDYNEIPHFIRPTVPGHSGKLVSGILGGIRVVFLQGRVHYYETRNESRVTFPIRSLSRLGIEILIVTNAAGGLRKTFSPGDIMLIRDHINLMGVSPLRGSSGRDAFVDMSDAYSAELRRIAREVALSCGIELKSGVLAGLPGPSYETPSEVRFMARVGGDAACMSTIPEVIEARGLGIKVLGFSCITNLATGISSEKLTHEEVEAVGSVAADKLGNLIEGVLKRIGGDGRA
ncbi:MAG: purine-nucleoside phosphorylase [Candidatus Eisenbacteria bacterium]|nr:purine-nucleoside phosphorylase [Candidatus Eisenbacteria bacterium]